MRNRRLLIAAATAALALPALAQDRAPAVTGTPATPPPASNEAQPEPTVNSAAQAPRVSGAIESLVEEVTPEHLPPPPPAVEIPDRARRDPALVGVLDPSRTGLGEAPWGDSSGAYLSTLMRRMDTPIASRWAHITVRNALLARAAAPGQVHPVDWVAERAWLLLRLGEADAARMLVAGVDVDRFTPKMYQVALQTALATADPSALCPLEGGLGKVESRVQPLVAAICSALAGEPESAAAQIDSARRRGTVGGADLVLAEKVVGAGSDTARAVTVDWEPVSQLNAWRFGMATATGMTLPERLIARAAPRVRAWQARSPLLSPEQKLESAKIAAGLGVFSSQSLVDLYSILYDTTDPNELAATDAWQLHLAFNGRDRAARLAAMRQLWVQGEDSHLREASRAALARAASKIAPDPELQADAPQLISSMLAAGYDRQAERWANAVRDMDDRYADAAWAMLALSAPDPRRIDLSSGRINAFIGRDDSPGRQRSALLLAGLAGLGRIDLDLAGRLNSRHRLGLERRSRWTAAIDRSAASGQAGTVTVLTATGMQTGRMAQVPSAHMLHAVAALRRTGQDFAARMIAAEALSRS